MQILTSTNVLLVCSIKTISKTICVMNLWKFPASACNTRSWMPPKFFRRYWPFQLEQGLTHSAATWMPCWFVLHRTYTGFQEFCINWNQPSILTSDPNWVQVRLHIQNPIWLAVNHLLFNRNPLRFSGGSCSSHVPAIDPEDTDQKLGRLPAGSVCEIKSTPSTEQQTTQNHPKTSNTPIFLGKILGGLFCCCIPFPPFFFGEKTSQIKGETSPLGPFTLLGTPTKPTESKNGASGSLQEVGWRLRGWNHRSITHEFLVGKKNPCKKVWPEVGNVEIYTNTSWNCIQTCFCFCFFG